MRITVNVAVELVNCPKSSLRALIAFGAIEISGDLIGLFRPISGFWFLENRQYYENFLLIEVILCKIDCT